MLKPNKYVEGIVDVCGAFELLDKAAGKFSLSDKGYALHAVQKGKVLHALSPKARAFLLMIILEADGEYCLNLLDLMGSSEDTAAKSGRALMERMFRIIDIKCEWADRAFNTSVAHRTVTRELRGAQTTLEHAMSTDHKIASKARATLEEQRLEPVRRVERFLEHTVTPRREWLVDLGCAEKMAVNHYVVTEDGERLLSFFRQKEFYRNDTFVLPFSDQLSSSLNANNLGPANNLFWRGVASSQSAKPRKVSLRGEDLLEAIATIYSDIRLYAFNQAEISAAFHAISCELAMRGSYLDEEDFDRSIELLPQQFPEKVFKLSKRRGAGGYIALRAGSQAV